ncbi:MAG: transcriptional regulator [Zetaproteobacteria bacterium CG_4_9_14_3_um_filter_49_83]|nr:MAG: transcriptional regulator [Zetaproteobacteria bacterium CG1_02_49_23]PIQ30698.1 MAG: transcriptional regulator [Zetaproteobacteria bacterium CG17_big_fil_post_rev_8_21_14_2_50_50_13]PIY57189.1 MAG: transcriptional regulator [Zetaproteobacteria bacterium CG_4_10_14_0_8_um_filter_49_80]PJA34464.1 MAG: transcriptional regulator [Zetaproteobacteria bacterium CG_4_9_14_3_um_filter_49_83]
MPKPLQTPSLKALRAFEVAGRLLNQRKAADVLCVTPSALSHQIRALEEYLGLALFIRLPKGLKLTAAGSKLLPQLTLAFDGIDQAIDSLQQDQRNKILTVSMLSTFAMRWFIPRLYRFRLLHPDIEVRISTSIELVDFNKEDIDCAIRSGQGTWRGTQSLRLLDEQFAPVCSPALISSEQPLSTPQQLSKHTLLHSKLRPNDWQTWLTSVDLPNLKGAQQLEFETRNFAIAAAIRGLGIAIIDPLLVEEELKDSRLIQPFKHTMPSSRAYYLVWPENRPPSPELSAFRSWLLSEVGIAETV